MTGDAAALADLQHRSVACCPDMDPLPAGFFRNPGLEGGRNLFCAVDSQGGLLAYAMVFNSDGDRRYCDIKVDPSAALAPVEEGAIRAALLEHIQERVQEMKRERDAISLLLYGCYFEDGIKSIDYLKANGFSIMADDFCVQLTLALQESTLPDTLEPCGVTVREWCIDSKAELVRYLEAHQQGLPGSPLTEEQLAFMVHSPRFTALAAFDGDAVVGCATAIPRSDSEDVLEYVYVLPQWQRRGIARYLVAAVLGRLKERGTITVYVETAQDNHAAIALYEWAGFRRARREVMLGRLV